MKKLVKERNLEDRFFIDSAGVIGYHAGEQADERMQRHALNRGINLTSIARKITQKDLADFDYVIAMDTSNYSGIKKIDVQNFGKNKIFMMTDFCAKYNEKEVPDPYYGGAAGFEYVLDLLEDACEGLLNKIINENEDLL